MLKMKEPPNNFMKTQGQIGTSQEVDDNKDVRLFSVLLYDFKWFKSDFLGSALLNWGHLIRFSAPVRCRIEAP